MGASAPPRQRTCWVARTQVQGRRVAVRHGSRRACAVCASVDARMKRIDARAGRSSISPSVPSRGRRVGRTAVRVSDDGQPHESPGTGTAPRARASRPPAGRDLIELTLNHGLFMVRAARSLAEAETVLAEWQPHLAVDRHGPRRQHGAAPAASAPRTRLTQSVTPVLGLTRRGDLKTKLRAFDLGVDDILTVPFSPEELLARAIVITRRASGTRPADRAHHPDRRDRDRHRRSRGARGRLRHPPERHRAEPAVPARQSRRTGRDAGRDPRRHLGHRLRRREQHRGPPRPEPARASSRTTIGIRASSRRSQARATGSSPRSPTWAGTAGRSMVNPRPTEAIGAGRAALMTDRHDMARTGPQRVLDDHGVHARSLGSGDPWRQRGTCHPIRPSCQDLSLSRS